jgi:hypothetical protein
MSQIRIDALPHSVSLNTRTPESSTRSLIQVVAIFIRTDFGGFYPEIGSGIQMWQFLSAQSLRPMKKSQNLPAAQQIVLYTACLHS